MTTFNGSVFGLAALVTLGIQWGGFVVAYLLQTEVFYDILGGLNYLTLAWLGCGHSPSIRLQYMTLVFVASRGWLLLFLAWRAHSRKGDSRFDGVKDKFGLFLVYWTVQALWVYLISWPLLTVQALERQGEQVETSTWDSVFLVGFALGVMMEIVADVQKTIWVGNGRQGCFCAVGLWTFSRHPNYFAEILQWWCAWLLSFGSLLSVSLDKATLFWFAGIVSPLFSMNILLNTSGTGIWNAEGKNLRRYYESEHGRSFQEYMKSTSPLIPMIGYGTIPLWAKRRFLFEWERYEYRPQKNT